MSSTVSPAGPVTKAQWSANTIPSAGPVGTLPSCCTLEDFASGGTPGARSPLGSERQRARHEDRE